jgi:hypothetical protein
MVFTGSSNLADGGESQNGDNLLHISDPAVASVFATEAVRLVDHYYFRSAVRAATKAQPLQLTPCGASPKWWARDYDPNNMRNVQRELFANGPSAVTSIPSGVSDSSSGTPPAPSPKKTGGKKKTTARGKKGGKKKTGKKKTSKKKTAKKRTARKKSGKKTAKKKPAKKTSSKKKAAKKKK